MTNKDWELLSSEVVIKNPWWEYKKDTYKRASGQIQEYHYTSKFPGATVVAIREDGRVAVVKQFRPSTQKVEIGIPAGGIEEGETSQEGAEKELREEAAATAEHWEYIGRANSTPGLSDDYMEMFIAHGLTLEEFIPTEEEEGLELEWWTAQEIDQGIEDGSIRSAWAIIPWLKGRKRIQEIIDGT